MGIKMCCKRLMLVPGTIEIALHLAAQPFFQRVGRRNQTWRERVDIVGNEGGAAPQPAFDLVGIGLQAL